MSGAAPRGSAWDEVDLSIFFLCWLCFADRDLDDSMILASVINPGRSGGRKVEACRKHL